MIVKLEVGEALRLPALRASGTRGPSWGGDGALHVRPGGPPADGGFNGKFLLARAAVGSGSWLLPTALVVSTGIPAYVYLRVIGATIKKPTLAAVASVRKSVMAGGQPELELSPMEVHYGMYVVIVLAVLGSVWLGVLLGSAIGL